VYEYSDSGSSRSRRLEPFEEPLTLALLSGASGTGWDLSLEDRPRETNAWEGGMTFHYVGVFVHAPSFTVFLVVVVYYVLLVSDIAHALRFNALWLHMHYVSLLGTLFLHM
jgi:hypothetical protein